MSTLIIAEAGVNHNGSLDMAVGLVDAAVAAGADAVKFQTFRADNLVTQSAQKARYQSAVTDPAESQWAMLRSLELSLRDHEVLMEYCAQKGIEFLSTPFDEESLDLLVLNMKLPCLKISSGDLTNAPLLLRAARFQRRVILSTGMGTMGEVEQALSVLAYGYTHGSGTPSVSDFVTAYADPTGQAELRRHVTLLHCTTEYPSPFHEVNLRVLETLRKAFGVPVGLSDHTPGIAVPIAAVTLGASVVEKHFTLDRNLPGPDHRASLEPHELKAMVDSIRQVEQAMGNSVKMPMPSEMINRHLVRKSLVAKTNIRQGQPFTENNLTCKRPGDGISPMLFWEYLDKTADEPYDPDEQVKPT